jgi:hypothetical protein
LTPCQGGICNTSLLPVQQPDTNDYHPVHDLCTVKQAVVTLHLVVPNPYTLLVLTPAEETCFSCLNFKKCILLHPVGTCEPTHLCFSMGRPPIRGQQQLTWTRLPQGFKNSRTIFGTDLTSDLQAYPAEEAGCTLLQYVHNFLHAATNYRDCLKGTELLLISYGKLDTKHPEKRLKSTRTKLNT